MWSPIRGYSRVRLGVTSGDGFTNHRLKRDYFSGACLGLYLIGPFIVNFLTISVHSLDYLHVASQIR